MDWIYGRQVVRLACADGAKRRPHRLAATAEGLAWLAAHGVGVKRRSGRFEVETVTPNDCSSSPAAAITRAPPAWWATTPTWRPTPCSARELLVVLDEVTDPRNLGADRAQRPGGRGRRPRGAPAPLGRGHAGGRQGLGRRDRTPGHRSRDERGRLSRAGQAGRRLGVRGRGRRRTPLRRARSHRQAWRSCSAPRGAACGRWCAAPATSSPRSPCRVRSAAST